MNSRSKHLKFATILFARQWPTIWSSAHCASREQLADLTTKALLRVMHQEITERIMILDCFVVMTNVEGEC